MTFLQEPSPVMDFLFALFGTANTAGIKTQREGMLFYFFGKSHLKIRTMSQEQFLKIKDKKTIVLMNKHINKKSFV